MQTSQRLEGTAQTDLENYDVLRAKLDKANTDGLHYNIQVCLLCMKLAGAASQAAELVLFWNLFFLTLKMSSRSGASITANIWSRSGHM